MVWSRGEREQRAKEREKRELARIRYEYERRAPEHERKAEEAAKASAARKAASAANQARLAYERGDVLFQARIIITDQEAIVLPVTSRVTQDEQDVTTQLNDIAREGWDLINGSVIFQPTIHESRDKFLSSGQEVAVAGHTIGYYLFKRRAPSP